MSKQHGAREQKKLAKHKVKRENRRRQLARLKSPDPTIRLQPADRWPVAFSLVSENLWDSGLGQAVLARNVPDGQLACAVFLLDVFCLGVKDAFWRILAPADFADLRARIEEQEPLRSVAPEYFAKLVYQRADYGQSLGFPPHRDFRHAQRLLAGIDPSQCADEFQFGQDGRPHYIRGPHESLEQARLIAERVTRQGGYYTIPLSPDDRPPAWLDVEEPPPRLDAAN